LLAKKKEVGKLFECIINTGIPFYLNNADQVPKSIFFQKERKKKKSSYKSIKRPVFKLKRELEEFT
jgi:hypothetical protein